jgi:PKD repeat protein
MFTEGQKARMIATLNSNVSDRNNLYADSNLIATGTKDGTTSPCAPIAGIAVQRRYVCSGDSVQFLDASSNGTVDNYLWEFPTGTPSTSTAKNPFITFNTPGWQPVKLTVSNAQGNSVKTENQLIMVAPDIAYIQAPYVEDFESPGAFNNKWLSINYDNNNTSFTQVDYAAHTGVSAAQLNNYYSHADQDIDELISPAFDLTSLNNPGEMNLSFYYSLGSGDIYLQDLPDSIVVSASINCGSSWSTIYKIGGIKAVNAGYVQGFFIPSQSPSFWKKVSINLAQTLKQPNVRFKFSVWSAVRGNNFYIDDINLGNLYTGIENPQPTVNSMNIVPNPTTGTARLSIDIAKAGALTIKIFDITGKEVSTLYNGTVTEGNNTFDINEGTRYAKGVYIISVKSGDLLTQTKLVVQ